MNAFERYIELQEFLLEENEQKDIKFVYQTVNSYYYVGNQKKTLSTIRLISSIAYARPKLFDNFVELLKQFPKININPDFYEFKTAHPEIQNRILTIYLLFQLTGHKKILNDDFKGDSFLDPIEFFHKNPDLVGENSIYRGKNYESDKIAREYDAFAKMSSDQLIEYRNKRHSTHPLAQIIIDDDVDQLQKLLSKSNFSIDDRNIFNSYFEINEFLNEAKLIEYSSFYGSINCFKYLINQDKSIDYDKLIKYAIAGGNYDIIHIVEQNGHFDEYPDDLIDYAILYFRNDLIDYIIENYNVDINANNYINCIYASNYEALSHLHELDESDYIINQYGPNGSTPIDIAAFEGYLDFFKYMVNTFNEIDVQILNLHDKTVLHSAVKAKKEDLVKYIIKYELVDPRIKCSCNYTALDFSYFKFGYDHPLTDDLESYMNDFDKKEKKKKSKS